MSRIGKLPIAIPKEVKISNKKDKLFISGKYGELNIKIPNKYIFLHNLNGVLTIYSKKSAISQAQHGLFRALIQNTIKGVSEQYTKTLLLNGVGYRAILKDKKIILNLGYSHTIELIIPKNISVEVIKQTTIILKSHDKINLGLFASKIRSYRTPEPYKGKGIFYKNETIKRKAGKSGKK